MFERAIIDLRLEDPGQSDASSTRERLKAHFPQGSARRMTLLGMMVGSTLQQLGTDTSEALIYSSAFGESLSLENYLRSFPSASPTLFQTSIHPSGLQQGLILRQKQMREVMPLAGGPELVLQSALATLANPAGRVIWCGGEERGTWLRELGVAADRSFAFALALGGREEPASLGRVALAACRETGRLELGQWFELLRDRKPWSGPIGTGWRLDLSWA